MGFIKSKMKKAIFTRRALGLLSEYNTACGNIELYDEDDEETAEDLNEAKNEKVNAAKKITDNITVAKLKDGELAFFRHKDDKISKLASKGSGGNANALFCDASSKQCALNLNLLKRVLPHITRDDLDELQKGKHIKDNGKVQKIENKLEELVDFETGKPKK